MEFFNSIPERKNIIGFIKQKGLSEDKLIHSIAVTNIALNIAEKVLRMAFKLIKMSLKLEHYCMTLELLPFGERDYEAEMAEPVPEHCSIGATMVLEAGFPEKVAHCVEAHECWIGSDAKACRFPEPVKKDYLPKTMEAKAVAYADIVITVAVEEGYDLWKDPNAVAKTYHSYFNKCFKNATGEDIGESGSTRQYKELISFTMKCLDIYGQSIFQKLGETSKHNQSNIEIEESYSNFDLWPFRFVTITTLFVEMCKTIKRLENFY